MEATSRSCFEDIREYLGGIEKIREVEQGDTAQTLLLEGSAETYYLKTCDSAAELRTELSAMEIAESHQVEVPVVEKYDLQARHPWMLTRDAGETLTNSRRTEDFRRAGRTLAQIHESTSLGRNVAVADRLESLERYYYEFARDRVPEDILNRLHRGFQDSLSEAGPLRREVSLLHMDFTDENICIPEDPGQNAVTLDWANSRYGDPLLDLRKSMTELKIRGFPYEEFLQGYGEVREPELVGAPNDLYDNLIAIYKITEIESGESLKEWSRGSRARNFAERTLEEA